MDLLDDIWDIPAENASTEHRTSSSPKTSPLFLEDSGDENPLRLPRQQPLPAQEVDIDIDAMFADVENADDPFNFKPLAPSIDTEALRRDAEARHKKNVSSSIPTISGTMGEDGHGSQTTSGKADKPKQLNKERRQPMRLDEARLLGPTGFPKLIKETKGFRIKGKGHEADDLNRLLQVYSYWSHEMYPKTTFRDTVERVEKLCHSKRMHVALSVWRDEARGLPYNEVIDIDEEENAVAKRSPGPSSPTSEGVTYVPLSSRSPTRPPSSTATELGDEDDFDIDTIIQKEEHRLKEQAASQTFGPFALGNDPGKTNERTDEEDAAMWEAMDVVRDDPSSVARISEDGSGSLEALTSIPSPPPTKPAIQVEDEEMWDIVREMENDGIMAQITNAASIPPNKVTTTNGQDEDDDWDSVYV